MKGELGDAEHRSLTQEEAEAIQTLRLGKVDFVVLEGEEDQRISHQLKMRVIASILAEESCLKCHEGEAGDLLGAFEYHLARAKDEVLRGSD